MTPTTFDGTTITDVTGRGKFNPEFCERVNKLQELHRIKYGNYFEYASTYRSNAEQQVLYDKYLHGGNPAAKPGTSRHNFGAAFDSATKTAKANNLWFVEAAGKCDIHNFPKENWHFSDTGH